MTRPRRRGARALGRRRGRPSRSRDPAALDRRRQRLPRRSVSPSSEPVRSPPGCCGPRSASHDGGRCRPRVAPWRRSRTTRAARPGPPELVDDRRGRRRRPRRATTSPTTWPCSEAPGRTLAAGGVPADAVRPAPTADRRVARLVELADVIGTLHPGETPRHRRGVPRARRGDRADRPRAQPQPRRDRPRACSASAGSAASSSPSAASPPTGRRFARSVTHEMLRSVLRAVVGRRGRRTAMADHRRGEHRRTPGQPDPGQPVAPHGARARDDRSAPPRSARPRGDRIDDARHAGRRAGRSAAMEHVGGGRRGPLVPRTPASCSTRHRH